MAEWIIDGRPSMDLWPLDVRRFQFHHNTRAFMYDRGIEIYAKHYAMKWPVEEHELGTRDPSRARFMAP